MELSIDSKKKVDFSWRRASILPLRLRRTSEVVLVRVLLFVLTMRSRLHLCLCRPTFWRICKAKDVEGFKPDPYLATLLNCMLWVFYGIPIVHPNSILVVTINGIGLVIEAAYLTIFFLYSSGKKRVSALPPVLRIVSSFPRPLRSVLILR